MTDEQAAAMLAHVDALMEVVAILVATSEAASRGGVNLGTRSLVHAMSDVRATKRALGAAHEHQWEWTGAFMDRGGVPMPWHQCSCGVAELIWAKR